MSASRKSNRTRTAAGELIKKLRKPMPGPVKVEEGERKYNRARERERTRRTNQK